MRYRLDRFLHAKNTYNTHTPVQAFMREKLLKMILDCKQKEFAKIFEFGSASGEFTQMLEKALLFDEYICNDINDYGCKFSNEKISIQHFDMNKLALQDIFHKRFNLIASNACLQWLNFSNTLKNLTHMLECSGMLLLSTFLDSNFKEVRQITGIGLEYMQGDEIYNSVHKNFEILAWHEEHITLTFQNALEVFRHMKYGGVNAFSIPYLKRAWLQEYENLFHNKLTYHILCFLAKKKGV